MSSDVRIFTSPEIMADSLAEEFYRHVLKQFSTRNKLYIALSGGNTPMLFFERLSNFNQQKKNKIDWKNLHFFWGDERCVDSGSPDSNFGNAHRVLFSQIDIPEENVHRINGEADPEEEALRYADHLLHNVPVKGGIPIFDWVFLGIGDDGHTASIFPDQMALMTSEKICAVATHNETGQKRITLTGTVINHAKRVTFMATGSDKQAVISAIHNREAAAKKLPASKIAPQHGTLDWYLDSEAADDI